MKTTLVILAIILSTSTFAEGICDRHEDIQRILLKSLGLQYCQDVKNEHLWYVDTLYIEYGHGLLKNDNTRIEVLTERDLAGLYNLKTLSMQQTGISNLDKEAFRDLRSLTTWDFSHNPLKGVPGDLFEYMPNLMFIEFDGFDKERTWEAVSLPENLFQGLKNLRQIDVDDLGFSTLPVGIFKGLDNLTKIDMGQNKVSHLPVGIFEGLPELKKLILEGNPLKDNGYSKKSRVFRPIRRQCRIKL